MSPTERVARPAVHILRSAGHQVSDLRTPADANTWLRVHRADVAVIDLCIGDDAHGKDAAALIHRLKEQPSGKLQLLVLAGARGEAQMRYLFEDSRLTNFLTYGEDQALDPVELTATVAKILTGEIFGLDRYLAPNAQKKELKVRSSSQKQAIIDELEEFARAAGCHQLVAQGVAVAGDELLTNAVYNAPVDALGQSRFASWPRTREVTLEPHEEVTFTFGFDGRKLGLSASDPFGSLKPARILDYLAKCFKRGDDQIDQKDGGAGLGLFTLFNMVHHFIINIAPQKRTEAIGLVEVTKSYRHHNARARSFNVFIDEQR